MTAQQPIKIRELEKTIIGRCVTFRMRWETLLFAAAIKLQKRGAMEVAGGNYTTTHS